MGKILSPKDQKKETNVSQKNRKWDQRPLDDIEEEECDLEEKDVSLDDSSSNSKEES